MKHPLIIAHRSLTNSSVENARSSLRRAADEGADLIELDVRLTLDRKPVILHDPLLGRTTTGHGPVGLWPSPLLRRVGLRHSEERDRVPTVREILEIAPGSVQLAFHLKTHRALRPALQAIRRYGSPSRCWLWLERMEDVFVATRELPELRCTLLRPAAWTPARRGEYFHDAQASGARGVSIPTGAVSRDLVQHAHQHHLLVFSQIDHPGLLPDLLANGLDGAITADASETFEILRSLGYR